MKLETLRFSFLLMALLIAATPVAQSRQAGSDASARSWRARRAQLEQAGAINSALNAGRRGLELARRSAPDDLPFCLNAVASLHLAQDEYELARERAREALAELDAQGLRPPLEVRGELPLGENAQRQLAAYAEIAGRSRPD